MEWDSDEAMEKGEFSCMFSRIYIGERCAPPPPPPLGLGG